MYGNDSILQDPFFSSFPKTIDPPNKGLRKVEQCLCQVRAASSKINEILEIYVLPKFRPLALCNEKAALYFLESVINSVHLNRHL